MAVEDNTTNTEAQPCEGFVGSVAQDDVLSFDIIPPEKRPVGATATLAELGAVDFDDVTLRMRLDSKYLAPTDDFRAALIFIKELSNFAEFRVRPPSLLLGDRNGVGGVYAVPANYDEKGQQRLSEDTIAIKIV